jgi:hypothetical protein
MRKRKFQLNSKNNSLLLKEKLLIKLSLRNIILLLSMQLPLSRKNSKMERVIKMTSLEEDTREVLLLLNSQRFLKDLQHLALKLKQL